MDDADRELLEMLMETYRTEGLEHLKTISAGLLELERAPDPERVKEILEEIFRSSHSLKGGARIINLTIVEFLCQSLEELFSALRKGTLGLSQPLLDLMLETSDVVEQIISSPTPDSPPVLIKSTALILRNRLEAALCPTTAQAVALQPLPVPPIIADECPPSPCGMPALSQVEGGTGCGGICQKTTSIQNSTVRGISDDITSQRREVTSPTPRPPPAEERGGMPVPATSIASTSSPEAVPLREPSAAPAGEVAGGARRKPSVETVRIPANRLDSLLIQAEELIYLKLAMRQNILGLKGFANDLDVILHEYAADREPTRNMLKELTCSLATLGSRILLHKRACEEDSRLAAGMVETLILDAKTLLMFPFSSVTDALVKMVRDLARDQGKEVEFQVLGEGIEVDNRILQELKDPLVHILRNSIDHGIELPAERQAAGKPRRASLRLSAACIDNGKVEVVIRDDGRGIDRDRVKSAAVNRGAISREEAEFLSDAEALRLIFRSGVSSRSEVTHLSGRGLGLAIVEEKAEKLGGVVKVTSTPGGGTTFTLTIPLSLATFRGIQIRIGEQRFALPTTNVRKVCRVSGQAIKTVETRDTILFDGRTVPVVSLADVLGIPTAVRGNDHRTVMLLGAGDELVAFDLDEVISEDDLLAKGLGPQLKRVKNISGATVLGNGTVVPILNANDLLKSAMGCHYRGSSARLEPVTAPAQNRARRVLVTDDSITSRTLLKNVLESYGYEVKTACDGFDALAILQAEEFDLATLDVEMPRMDGFELTARIRATERLMRLPVILVTGLDSAEDKKKGIDAGADAYIVKSSFDQSNLLDIIRKLI